MDDGVCVCRSRISLTGCRKLATIELFPRFGRRARCHVQIRSGLFVSCLSRNELCGFYQAIGRQKRSPLGFMGGGYDVGRWIGKDELRCDRMMKTKNVDDVAGQFQK